jgi:hypothetical protein
MSTLHGDMVKLSTYRDNLLRRRTASGCVSGSIILKSLSLLFFELDVLTPCGFIVFFD